MQRFFSVCAIAAAFVIALSAAPGRSSVPQIPNNETRYFKTYYASPADRPDMSVPSQRDLHNESPQRYSEKVKWTGTGPTRILTIARDETLYSGNTLKSEFVISVGRDLTMIKAHRTWISKSGEIIRERDDEFTDPSFGYPKNTYHLIAVPWLLRLSDLAPKVKYDWYVWIDSYFVYPITLEVEGEEKVTTEAGTFDTWRCLVQLDKKRIDDIMGTIVASSQSRFLMWYDKNNANGLVKLVYPIATSGTPGQPKRFQTQELIKVEY